MSINDFCRLSPSQFQNVIDKWEEKQRVSWEQTRRICYYAIRPHLRKDLDAKEFWRFPWECNKDGQRVVTTREQDKKDFERIKKQYAAYCINDNQDSGRSECGTEQNKQ